MAGQQQVGVFVSGGGPVGLMLTYQLARLGLSTYIIDAADKASPRFPMCGRACTLYPHTLEMLDQLDLYDEMAQTGLIGRRNVTFKDGKRVQGRGWNGMENIGGTYFDFCLNIRLKYSEDIFRDGLAKLGVKAQAPIRLVNLSIDDKAADDYKVTATCTTLSGENFQVKSKYIVGRDGGSSAVRKLAGIPFDGSDKEDHLVRIDGIVKTSIPDSRLGFGAFESKTHGHVLWVAIDHGATRIDYVLSPEMYAKYGRHMSQADAIKEAQAAVAPFELQFEQVNWHTVYGVKQHVAGRLQDRDRVLLAGDAAHTHSSGSAQEINTGTHDVVNLGWRLAGVVNGWYRPEVLANYSNKRKAVAQQLIDNNKIISALMSGHKSLGLGITYPENLLNDVSGSSPPIGSLPGHRAPDALIQKPGFGPTAVFTGEARDTRDLLKTLCTQVDKQAPKFEYAIAFRNIIAGTGLAFAKHLGVEQFGEAYWDVDHAAHVSYKISLGLGAITVLRPDGILGFVAPLDRFDRLAKYLDRLVVPREPKKVAEANGLNGPVGEMINQDENNLYYQQAKEQSMPASMEQGAAGRY